MSEKLPPFYCIKTLLGFGSGPDLNQIILQMPGGNSFELCKMNESRTDEQIQRWHNLAKALSKTWEDKR